MKHQITVRPGDTLEVVLAETLSNGYPDETGWVKIFWQDREPRSDSELRSAEIATKTRELQVDFRCAGGKVGPVKVTHA